MTRPGGAGGPGEVNIGLVATGTGPVTVTGPVIGKQVNHGDAGGRRTDPAPNAAGGGRRLADIGVLTVIQEETRAVVAVLRRWPGCASGRLRGGAAVHRVDIATAGGPLRVVATQSLDRGPQSTALAYQALRAEFGPPVVLLVGIAGGISPYVDIGDVVVADQVIAYDARREAADGTHRRGQAHLVAPALQHRVNDFLRRHGDPVRLPSTQTVRVVCGPIGSGGAVVTDALSELRDYLSRFNEKTLAVETEAAGLAAAVHEEGSADVGWLVIRGISDHADAAKGTRDHALAANHAAEVMALLLPSLVP